MLRRLETQADCFSGQFMRSVSQSLGIQQADVAGIQATWEAVGDDTLTGDDDVDGNHGLARSRVYWGSAGFNNSAISSLQHLLRPRPAGALTRSGSGAISVESGRSRRWRWRPRPHPAR